MLHKNHTKEDKHTCKKACAQIGQHVLREEQEKQKRKQLTEQNYGDDQYDDSKRNDKSDNLSIEIEGLGRIITDIYAKRAQDTVSLTLSHMLITQDGERFVYLQNFTPFLMSQLEDYLKGNDFSNYK